uniref:ATP synthase F0 subunit 8 n=1 Tax=Phoronopsis harmeri TaxID=490051 RepID=J9PMY3_9BILA|nr:ATP synthase F0 subunit 8 [Phoronopsis harmeri]AES86298.1 ATP synthase F0 subunit 8 [Phoronopsis harmeri]
MPQLAPILWFFMFSFFWIILILWLSLSWYASKNTFKALNNGTKSSSFYAWAW